MERSYDVTKKSCPKMVAWFSACTKIHFKGELYLSLILDLSIKMLVSMSAFHIGVHRFSSQFQDLTQVFCPVPTLRDSSEGSSNQVLTTHVGELDWVIGSWLRHCRHLDIEVVDDTSLSIFSSLYASQIAIKKCKSGQLEVPGEGKYQHDSGFWLNNWVNWQLF